MSDAFARVVRVATIHDADEVAGVWLASRHASVPQIPPPVHSDDDVRRWFADEVLSSRQEVYVIEEEERITAVLVLDGSWVEHVYVLPGRTGRGLGSQLIELAKAHEPFLQLWVFQTNVDARRFYERHGFVAVETTDGDNEERAPDVRYEWRVSPCPEPASAARRPRGVPRLMQTVLDCTDARGLAEFYRQLLGLEYRAGDEAPAVGLADPNGGDWLVLVGPDGSRALAFQQVAELRESTWPDGAVPQQLHLDLTVATVEDLELAHERAVGLGARLRLDRSDDPEEALRAYADPAGHTFCIFVVAESAGA